MEKQHKDEEHTSAEQRMLEEILNVDVSMVEVFSRTNIGGDQKKHQRTLAPS